MPDNINISNSIPVNPPVSRPVQAPRDLPPTSIVEPNSNTAAGGDTTREQPGMELLLSRNSVFSTFVGQLRQVPALSQTLQKLAYELLLRKAQDGEIQSVPSSLRALAAAMNMDETQMLDTLLFQKQNYTKFHGALFDVLRTLSRQHPNTDFQSKLAAFLKAFDAYFGAESTMSMVDQQLQQLQKQLPKFYATRLASLLSELQAENSEQARMSNLRLLKERILPALGEYAHVTKDTGSARDTITLLVHTLARLNLVSRGDMDARFAEVMDDCRYQLQLPRDILDGMETLYRHLLENGNQPVPSDFSKALVEVLSQNDGKALYKDLGSALLLDNSVYMPFVHLFLPVHYEGKFLFSELWVEKEPSPSSGNDGTNSNKVYLTFSIQDVGYFEMGLELQGKRLRLNMLCPPSMVKQRGDIQSALTDIFGRNGFTVSGMTISGTGTPRVTEQIMRKVWEWRKSVDVTI